MTEELAPRRTLLTVGQVAERLGVTVRTLHHYDEVGLLRPSARSHAGYRLYTDEDLERLQSAVVYRRLGFPLEQVRRLLDEEDERALVSHLRRQRDAVSSRIEELQDLVEAIDRALAKERIGVRLTKEEQRELFGDGFSDEYAAEAERRWGDTEAWQQSQERTSQYTKEQWQQIKAEAEELEAAFVAAMDGGEPPSGPGAMDVAEAARQHIHTWFYDLTPEFHRSLGDLYVQDARFTKTYDDLRPGLAQYVRDAIHANADRQAQRDGTE